MKVEQGGRRRRPEAGRRVAVLVVVAGCHLALLLLVSGPAVRDQDASTAVENNPLAIRLRFFRQQKPPLHTAIAPPSRQVSRVPAVLAKISKKPKESLAPQRSSPVSAPPRETFGTDTPSIASQHSLNQGAAGDGGFQQRLLNAKSSYAAPRLPGADTPIVTGVQLADPMSQGIGAVMRNTQRLFGIKSSHCIDVDTWRRLTPQELSARHISPYDVDKTDEKYACNAPPGLHF